LRKEDIMKVAIIGCTHAGTAAAINTAKMHKDAQVTVYERNSSISFLSCGIALSVSGVVNDAKELFYSSPEDLKAIGVNPLMRHDVTEVDLCAKTLKVMNLDTGTASSDTFDKLIITTGSWPVTPVFPGIDLENCLLCKNYDHAKAIIEKAKDAKSIAVVGAGYIGVELAEAFRERGKEVALIDIAGRMMGKYLDPEFTFPAEELFRNNGIRLALGEVVKELRGEGGKVSAVVTNKASYPADLVVMCVGFRPNTELFRGQLEMMDNGAIIVDEYMRTSLEDVYAAGDSAAIIYNPTKCRGYIPLATNAVRMGLLAAANLKEPKLKYLGTQATSGIKIYGLNLASTGLTEEAATELGLSVSAVSETTYFTPKFMPGHALATLKIVYRKDTRVILGAQLCSKEDRTQLINTLSVCLQNEMTMEEIAMVDQFFQPQFNTPWNLINTVALKALN
jgi:NADPH-dependent 2,4-dienoyl-CoA reductase/sulfur reductase-like enzyme